MDDKALIYELSFEQLQVWLADRGEPSYRAAQVYEWAYQHDAASFDDMSNLPGKLREMLAENLTIGPANTIAQAGDDEAEKLLLEMPGGGEIECVAMRMAGYNSACLSSQVGCGLGCTFCATGLGGWDRNLTAGEILLQLISLRARVGAIRNVVFMGMGEAFHNYEAVVTSIERMTDKRGMGMSPGRITVSTAGIVPAIHRYAKEGPRTELTVSLNASNQEQRDMLMPGVARWDLGDLLAACADFSEARNRQEVTFAYVLIAGVNDDYYDADRVVRMLKGQPHHLNLIPWNEVEGMEFKATSPKRADAFYQRCMKSGLNVSLRHSKGVNIAAACGQLRRRES